MSGICDTCKRKCHARTDGLKSCNSHMGGKSNYARLFGTPERAARTLEAMALDSVNWCNDDSGNHRVCKACPYEYDYYGCYLPDGFSLLEWLKEDS